MVQKGNIILILALIPILAFSQKNDDMPKSKLNVYLVGVVHAMHFDSDKHYSVVDIQEQIKALKPNLVCGEITPEAFEQPMEGYFPPEAALLAEMASELNYRFEPVDWRLDYYTQARANSEYPIAIKEKRSALLDRIWDDMAKSNSVSMYDFIHDEQTLQLLDTLYEEVIGTNALAEIATGSWNERNRRIVENAMATLGNAHTIVFVFGIDHLPQIRRHLKDIGIGAKIPKRLFTPSNNHKVSDSVRKRWQHNMENLILIRDKKLSVTYDDFQKVTNSRRIQDLEQAIKNSL